MNHLSVLQLIDESLKCSAINRLASETLRHMDKVFLKGQSHKIFDSTPRFFKILPYPGCYSYVQVYFYLVFTLFGNIPMCKKAEQNVDI